MMHIHLTWKRALGIVAAWLLWLAWLWLGLAGDGQTQGAVAPRFDKHVAEGKQ